MTITKYRPIILIMCEIIKFIQREIRNQRAIKLDSTETKGYIEIVKMHSRLIEMQIEEKPVGHESVKELADLILKDTTQNTNERQFYRSVLLYWSSYEMDKGREGIFENLPPLKPL